MKPPWVGVCGLSKYSFPDRVWRGGGGIGMLKSGLLDLGRKGELPGPAMLDDQILLLSRICVIQQSNLRNRNKFGPEGIKVDSINFLPLPLRQM